MLRNNTKQTWFLKNDINDSFFLTPLCTIYIFLTCMVIITPTTPHTYFYRWRTKYRIQETLNTSSQLRTIIKKLIYCVQPLKLYYNIRHITKLDHNTVDIHVNSADWFDKCAINTHQFRLSDCWHLNRCFNVHVKLCSALKEWCTQVLNPCTTLRRQDVIQALKLLSNINLGGRTTTTTENKVTS